MRFLLVRLGEIVDDTLAYVSNGLDLAGDSTLISSTYFFHSIYSAHLR